MRKLKSIGLFMVVLAVAVGVTVCTLPVVDNVSGGDTTPADTTAPTLEITQPANNITNTNYVYTVSGTANDETSLEGVYLSHNNSTFKKLAGTTSWSTNFSNLAEGSNVINVFSKDTANNTSPTNSVLIWVDTGTPLVTVDPSALITNEAFTATLWVDDNYGYWSTNGVSNFNQFAQGNVNINIIRDTTLLYYSDNGVGDVSSTQTIVYQVIPDVTITDGPASNIITNTSFDVELTTTADNGYWLTNGTSFISFSIGTATITIIKNTTLQYYGSSDGINTSATNSVMYTFDTTPPTVPVISGNDSADTTPTWSWNTVPTAVKYRYSFVDGSGWTETNITNFTPTTNLAVDTTNTLYVQAGDLAGNWSTSGNNTIVVLPIWQIFTEINPGSLTGVAGSSILGDIDNDGDLDLILTGYNSAYVSKIYINNGSGGFTEINPGSLTGVSSSSIDLGDIDNDGNLDLILTGYNGSTAISKIYTNNGSGGFTEINPGSLTGVSASSIDLGDIDNDGDLDLILTGLSNSISGISKIYTNNGSGSFTEINHGSLTGVYQSSIDLGDIDNDSDLDLILTGYNGYVSKIYTNSGNGSFTEINPGSLTGVRRSSIKLGDIDNDSDLDLILTGYNGYVSKIYTNSGNGSFTEINPGSLTGVMYSSIDMGDIDNDGDFDLILSGDSGSGGYVSKIYTNNGSGGFTEIYLGSLTGVRFSSIDLGDIDNDGDLDLILTGSSSNDYVSMIYRNNISNN